MDAPAPNPVVQPFSSDLRIAPPALGYRPALDGLRGVAILGVVAIHTGLVNNRSAMVGVDLFFVLSGFLITTLLIEEWDRTGRIRLKDFYYRRVLRLFPALVVLLAVFVTYYSVTGPAWFAASTRIDALLAFFYSTNWALGLGFRPIGVFAHTWSLSIEEQFYLLWPWILILGLRRTSSRASLFHWILLGVFLSVIERALLQANGANFYRLYFGTDAHADALLLGCAAAVGRSAGFFESPAGSARTRRNKPDLVRKIAALAGVLGLVYLTLYEPFDLAFDRVVVSFLIPFCSVLILIEAVLAERGILARCLSQSLLVYLGKVSYGLYLWHAPIFGLIQARHLTVGLELALEFALTAAAVLASYYLLERPILRLKARVSPRPQETTGAKHQRLPA